MLQNTFAKSTQSKKFTTSLVAGLLTASTLLLLGNGGNVFWFPPIVVFPLCIAFLLVSLILPFIWQILENRMKVNSEKAYDFLYSLIRYCTAFSIAAFGWKKIFGLQFIIPQNIASLPMNQQSGEWLTWYYFGYSHTFGLIIAVLQIAGASLLIFKRTLLFGTVVLFALMVNLMLVNICYHMNTGALVQSVLLTMGLLFLILSDYRRLVDFFLRQKMNLPSSIALSPNARTIIKITAILLSLLFTIYLKLIAV